MAERDIHGLVRERVGLVVEQAFRRNQESRCADSTLQRRLFQECLLQRVKSVLRGQSLDGGHALAVDLRSKNQAGVNNAAVDVYRAGSRIVSSRLMYGGTRNSCAWPLIVVLT